MNTNSVNSNSISEDRYEYYPYSSECLSDVKISTVPATVMSQNTQMPQKIAFDHLNDRDEKKKVADSPLKKAKDIVTKTSDFKKKYSEGAARKKGSSEGKPNIKDYMAVVSDLRRDGVEVDDTMVRANSTDCSGFIKMIYSESGRDLMPLMKVEEKKLKAVYGDRSKEFIKRDRGAELLRRASTSVNPGEVVPGDLVFFKEVEKIEIKKGEKEKQEVELKLTDYATHIGIVSRKEKDKDGNDVIYFIHKSTNGGVIESPLDSRARMGQKINYKDLNPTFGRIE
ncbi:MAG: hypothetical protein ACP5KG_06215 [Myxococcota bacterium]